MGNLLHFCGCENENDYSFHGIKETVPSRKKSTSSADELLKVISTPMDLPSNVTDLKIKTKNLIQKRNESPWVHYKDIKELGKGAYGEVHKVQSFASGNIRAMKIIPKSNVAEGSDVESIIKEIQILSLLDHPNIMKIFEFYEDDENFYIITEFCDKGDLAGLLEDDNGTLPEFVVKYFMKQIFESICYLHSKKIVHGDIKKENILLYSRNDTQDNFIQTARTIDMEISLEINQHQKENKSKPELKRTFTKKTSKYLKDVGQFEVKLADFGCAKMFKNNKLSGIIGTTYYCSPEVLEDKYNEVCDEWSCGVLMYFLLTGEPPFDGNSETEVENKIMHSNVDFNTNKLRKISSNCIDLMDKLLVKDPDKRMTAAEALKHPFFEGLDDVEKEMFESDLNDVKLRFSNLKKSATLGKSSKFKETVIAYISLNFVPKEEEEKIKNIFKDLSNDHSTYKITKEQFIKCLMGQIEDLTNEEAEKIFTSIDDDQNGFIEYQELIRSLSDKQKLLSKKNLKEAFDYFDEDKSGAISWGEIYKIITGGKVDSEGKEIMNEFLSEIGKKENEEITFEEFCELVTN